jgi:hypothetical protein
MSVLLQGYMVSQPNRQLSEKLPLWRPPNLYNEVVIIIEISQLSCISNVQKSDTSPSIGIRLLNPCDWVYIALLKAGGNVIYWSCLAVDKFACGMYVCSTLTSNLIRLAWTCTSFGQVTNCIDWSFSWFSQSLQVKAGKCHEIGQHPSLFNPLNFTEHVYPFVQFDAKWLLQQPVIQPFNIWKSKVVPMLN